MKKHALKLAGLVCIVLIISCGATLYYGYGSALEFMGGILMLCIISTLTIFGLMEFFQGRADGEGIMITILLVMFLFVGLNEVCYKPQHERRYWHYLVTGQRISYLEATLNQNGKYDHPWDEVSKYQEIADEEYAVSLKAKKRHRQ
jgi:hypothetical protein